MFLEMGQHRVCLAVQTIQGPPDEKRKRKGKRKAQRKIQELSLAKNKHEILKMWSEEDFAWWTKERKGKKGLSKDNDACQKGCFRLTSQIKAQARIIYTQNKGKGKCQKGKGKEEAHPQSGLSASDDWSSSQWPDDSWVPAAGWYCTKAYTAWMAVPS